MRFVSVVALFAGLIWASPVFAEGTCVDVESASAKNLEALKGVGPALSKRIIDYRKVERSKATKEGRAAWNFRNWATLMKVEGVGSQICTDNLQALCFSGKAQNACPAAK
jgi:DNA uptake protein ComE-like DNA-binding protein